MHDTMFNLNTTILNSNDKETNLKISQMRLMQQAQILPTPARERRSLLCVMETRLHSKTKVKALLFSVERLLY